MTVQATEPGVSPFAAETGAAALPARACRRYPLILLVVRGLLSDLRARRGLSSGGAPPMARRTLREEIVS